MKDYSSYKVQYDMVDFSRKWIFEEQLKQEGSFFKVNGKATQMLNGIETYFRAIIRRHGQDHKEFLEERAINFSKDFDIKLGDYIEYLDETFLINTHIDKDNPAYDCTKMIRCNNSLNAKGWANVILGYFNNSSYGDKGVLDSNYLSSIDGKLYCLVQDNEVTKNIPIDMRFLFDSDKREVYKVIKTETITTGLKGIRRITFEKDEFCDKDDLVNNIAYNDFLETPIINPQPTPTNAWNIISDNGDLAILWMCSRTFTVVDNKKMPSVDNWTITTNINDLPKGFIEIKETTNNSIKIRNAKGLSRDIPLKITFLRGSDGYKLECNVSLVVK